MTSGASVALHLYYLPVHFSAQKDFLEHYCVVLKGRVRKLWALIGYVGEAYQPNANKRRRKKSMSLRTTRRTKEITGKKLGYTPLVARFMAA